MLLRLVVDGEPWIADVGFGGLTFTAPLALQPDVVHHTPQGAYRLQSAGGGYVMQALLGQQWASLYSFDLTPQQPADYEATNWWLATHDSSPFLHMLAAARATADLRHTLRDGSYTCRDAHGVIVAQQHVTTAVQAVSLLQKVFDIDVPQGDVVLARLDTVLQQSR
jgi:N-hydroxyarylamine O-acetyltransferase